MGVVVRYVDKSGCVLERFLGLAHVSNITTTSLERARDSLLSTYDLSVSSLRGQGYDGASNMRGELKGLKTLINTSAYYVHCFAHQLQLIIVVVAKKHTSIESFFNTIGRLIPLLDMEDEFVPQGRVRRGVEKMKNLHHYRVELFCSVIDMQSQDLNQCFDEVNTYLLLCMACLDPKDSFSAFDSKKLLRPARYYPSKFSKVTLYELERKLETFIINVRIDEIFSHISGIGGLSQKMVSIRKHEVFPLVYLLIKLSLIFLVVTVSVERAFSAMKFIKTSLRNSMGDQLLPPSPNKSY